MCRYMYGTLVDSLRTCTHAASFIFVFPLQHAFSELLKDEVKVLVKFLKT